jgi:hypothetical protein
MFVGHLLDTAKRFKWHLFTEIPKNKSPEITEFQGFALL